MATVEEALAIVAAQEHVGMFTVEVEAGRVTELVVHYTTEPNDWPPSDLHDPYAEELVRARWRWEL